MTLPVDVGPEFGYVTMRCCLVSADQAAEARGIWEELCDDFGVPAESTKILRPQVRTEAPHAAMVEESVSDTAIVDGNVPAGTSLVFELYRQPSPGDAKRDGDGPADEQWTQPELAALNGGAVCEPEALIAPTTEVAVHAGAQQATRYPSPEVRWRKRQRS